ncbi:MAG TPA: MHYT domain-containing protein [Steroidobacteraceae bacterium]|nr:MHYT domain-containing protein [Steroidobacteraceae bacterium]
MHATYNPWLVHLSVIVAILVSYTALRLTERVAGAERRAGVLWLLGGAVSMGIGIWSMHFIGMLSFSVAIRLRYNLLINLASLFIGMLTSLFALAISSRRDLSLRRLAVSSVIMGAGICGMHYTGMAAVQIVPAITYKPLLVAASVVIAITASFVALWLFFRLRSGTSRLMRLARAGAAVVMGCAISGMHYTGMAAAMLAPGSYCYGGGAALDNDWLAVMVGMVALGVIAITLVATLYDAHLESRTRRDAMRLAELNASLQHGKSLLTLATEAAGIACWEYDLSARRILWTENEIPAIKAAGLDPREHPGALLAGFFPEDVAGLKAALRAALSGRRETCAMRMRVAAQNGGTIHLQAHARLFQDESGRLRRLLGVAWDVTEQVRQDERRLQLQLQLQEASRHAGMAEVATGVLHSVGNVLNSLGVSAAMLQARLRESRVGNVERAVKLMDAQGARLGDFFASDPRGRELPGYLRQLGEHLVAEQRVLCDEAQAVVTHVEHIGKIVAAQQTYARHGGSLEEIDVAELLEHALVMHFTGSAGITVRRENRAVGKAMVDRHKLLQIMGNLLSNARHALRERTQAPRELTVRLRALPPGFYAIDVEDTGVGISAESMQRLFEFGFTTKKEGHGFGLHASAILAREMGGELTARSDGTNRGACFTVRLPIAAAEAEPQRRRA